MSRLLGSIRNLRKPHGVSQATVVAELGINQTAVSDYEIDSTHWRKAAKIAANLLGSPLPRNCEFLTSRRIQSSDPLSRTNVDIVARSSDVPLRSIVTDHPGLSSVSIPIPCACPYRDTGKNRFRARSNVHRGYRIASCWSDVSPSAEEPTAWAR